MLMSDLLNATLPRIGRTAQNSGITIFQAATSIQSLIYKNLLDRKSELQATGDMSLSIPAFGYYATLPSNFIAPAERPKTEELIDDWMAGTITTYDNLTGDLVVNVSTSSGTDTLADWNIALGPTPGSPASNIGTSATSLLCGTGSKTLVTQAGLNLVAGQYLILSSENSPEGWEGRRHILEPNYLNDDDQDYDRSWWDWYGTYSQESSHPRVYKIIGSTIYIRPKPIVDILLIGRYYASPTPLTAITDTILWEGKFDEIFVEGCIRIIVKGISVPDADPDFLLFFKREFDTIVSARARLIPRNNRLQRSNYM
jgi:hypothetical protein